MNNLSEAERATLTAIIGGKEKVGELSEAERANMTPTEFRRLARRGEWTGGSMMACRGYAQANVTILPKEYAYDFLVFCNRNPRPCPVIDVTEVGDPHPRLMAPEADLRTDLTRYKVFKDGELVDEPTDISQYWRDDLVGFLLGDSNSFDWLLVAANVKFRFPGAFITNIQCEPAGYFSGPMVTTCRLFKSAYDAIRAVQITTRCLAVHGPPVHVGDPAVIGVKDISHADFDARPDIAPQQPEEIAMFWGCGITPEMTLKKAKLPLMISQGDVDLLITDRLTEELTVL